MMTQEERAKWELAKTVVDGMSEPPTDCIRNLDPIQGFDCTVNQTTDKKIKEITIWNDKEGICYAKTFDSSSAAQMAEKVFKR